MPRTEILGTGFHVPGRPYSNHDLARVLPHLGEYDRGDTPAAPWQETHIAPHVQSLRDSIVGPPSKLLWFVFGSVLVVLLVAVAIARGEGGGEQVERR